MLEIGQRICNWTIIAPAEPKGKDRRRAWLCQCKCGNRREVIEKDLKNGKSKSCGCSKQGAKTIDITGQHFGSLTVLRYLGKDKYGNAEWECLCSCGRKVKCVGYRLRRGDITTCKHHGSPTHEMSKTRLYRIWCGMRARCSIETATGYEYYGKRGISVCEEWDKDFLSFHKWAMENGYNDNLSIDRIDTNGNYEPTNCRFVTSSEQNRNRRPYTIPKRGI